MERRRAIGVGERAPDFAVADGSGNRARFYAYAGGSPAALLFGGPGDDSTMAGLEERLGRREDVAVLRVGDRAVAEAYGLDPDRATAVVLDPNLRVIGVVTGDGPDGQIVNLLDAAVHREPVEEVRSQAPVLLVPQVLDPGQCERLIDVHGRGGDVETGVERTDSGGDRAETLDATYKRRRDHTVEDPELLRELSTTIGRRLFPEVRKAFAFRASRFEGFKIARYDGESGGFFRAHRDNLTPSTAHRVFALTLNLNEEYGGGQLRFPEYGNRLYRPDAGAALIFSCAHLHEVCKVTAGRRFVLLSFLYADPPA